MSDERDHANTRNNKLIERYIGKVAVSMAVERRTPPYPTSGSRQPRRSEHEIRFARQTAAIAEWLLQACKAQEILHETPHFCDL